MTAPARDYPAEAYALVADLSPEQQEQAYVYMMDWWAKRWLTRRGYKIEPITGSRVRRARPTWLRRVIQSGDGGNK